jgi:DNA-binding beta-propeller fold protein YncE
MNATSRWVLTAALGLCAAAALAATAAHAGYGVLHRYAPGGDQGWDYLAVDAAARRVYVSHGDEVVVLDAGNGRTMGRIGHLDGVHGIALAPARHRGWISNGRSGEVTVFDTRTLKPTATLKATGANPDAVLYDSASDRVFTFNGRSASATAFDAASGKPLATIALPGKPEFAVSDGTGHVWVNIEDKSELVELDPKAAKVMATWSLAPCESPTGLALDAAHRRLFSVCQNRTMTVLDADDGHRVASVAIGHGPDGAAFDRQRGLVYSANGQDGTLTVVHEDDPDHYRVLATVPTQASARTLALDPPTGHLFLSAAQFAAHTEQGGPHHHPSVMPGSFTVLEVGRSP